MLTFLHTGASHVATFERLARAAAPDVAVRHVVAPDLLAMAMARGSGDPAVAAGVRVLVEGQQGLIVCTCSTLGPVVDALALASGRAMVRVDRAMAEAALAAGRKVLIVACLESTMAPTRALFEDVARGGADLRLLLLADAWRHFEAGDHAAYAAAIAAGVRDALGDADAVALAQASMAPAADLLGDLGVPLFASPAIGVAAALRHWRAGGAPVPGLS